MANLLKIFDYDVHPDDNQVETYVEYQNRTQRVNINLFSFEMWLRRNGRLGWESNTSDHTGEHVQRTGEMSMNEYWDYSTLIIHWDLLEYIQTSGNTITDLDGSIHSDAVAFLTRILERPKVAPLFARHAEAYYKEEHTS